MGKFHAVIKTKTRHSVVGVGFYWVCELDCGHTREVQAAKKTRREYKNPPVRLTCPECEKEAPNAD